MPYLKVSSPIRISVSWKKSANISSELYLSAFMLNRDGKVRDIKDIVYYGLDNQNKKELVLVDKSITVSISLQVSDSFGTKTMQHDMQVELGKLTSDICHVVFVVYSNGKVGLDSFKDAVFELSDNAVTKTITLNNNHDTSVRCVTVGNVERHGETWRFFEEGTAFLGGLELAYEEYTDISLRQTVNFETFCDNRRKEIIERNFFDEPASQGATRPSDNSKDKKSSEPHDGFFGEDSNSIIKRINQIVKKHK